MTTEPDDRAAGSPVRRRTLARLGWKPGRGRVPVVQQMTATECGAACLAMVLGYYGKTVSASEIRDVMGIGRDGSNAKTIVAAARYYGLRARGVSVRNLAQIDQLPTGTMLHWGFYHFVVLERVRRNGIDVVDPGFGRRQVSMEEFGQQFTGVALLFEPGERFERGERRGSRIWHYVRHVLTYTGYLPKILVISLLVQLFALALPILTGALVDRVVPRHDTHLLLILVVGLAALVIFYFLASMIRAHLLLHLRTLFDARMAMDFVDYLVELPYNFFQRRSTGDLMARLNSNTTIREIFTSGILSALLDGVLVLLYLLVLLWASATIALLVIALTALQVAAVVLSQRRQRELMAENLQIQARADSHMVELLSGIETLKVSGKEQHMVDEWCDYYVDVLNVTLQRGRLSALVNSFTATLNMASPLCVLSYGALLVLNGDLSLGTMLALNALAAGFFAPVSKLVANYTQLQLLVSYLERIEDVFKAEPEQDPTKVQRAPEVRGAIQLENVSFRYSPLSPLVLEDITVSIEPGTFVALVGRSGSGKSTLANLLVGLYHPSSGTICFDGIDIEHIELRSLRKQIGMVPQHPYLFGGAIRANICMGNHDMELERIEKAARQACIDEEIDAMPMRYDTVIHDGGASLSGGQRQRIALARALVDDPALLVLDEATSALDALVEAKVQESLAALECTRVVVAHRLSTVLHADLILVLEGGRLIEQGTHEELMGKGGMYHSLVSAQLA